MNYIFWICFLLIFYSLFGYFVLLRIVSEFIKRERIVDNKYIPFVSMILSVHNEENIIEAKIKNFLEIDYPENKMQLLIGSDNSNDRTEEIIKRYENQRIKLFSFKERMGKSAVLNGIISKSSGEVILFSDANTLYHKDTVKRIVRHFVEKKVGGVCGKLLLFSPNERNVGGWGEKIYWSYENKIKELEGKIRTTVGATGGIYAIRKELFQPILEGKNVACDFLIPLKIAQKGFDIVYDNEAIAEETASINIKNEFVRKMRIGSQCFEMLSFIIPLLDMRKGFISFGLWSHKIIRWFMPFLMMFVFITNIFLLDKPLYQFLFLLQVLFYFFAFLGFVLNFLRIKFFLFSAPFYFVAVNLALLIGFFRFLFTSPKPIWETTGRGEAFRGKAREIFKDK